MDEHDTARVFKALGDANRLRVLRALATRAACVCELAHALRLNQPNLSRHLRVLENAGLVASRREGAWTEYRLTPAGKALARLEARMTADDAAACADAAALARADRRRLCGTGVPKRAP